jgi:hypothetical protein
MHSAVRDVFQSGLEACPFTVGSGTPIYGKGKMGMMYSMTWGSVRATCSCCFPCVPNLSWQAN